MRPIPPKLLEEVVAFLIPPACREHVLGDLRERCSSTRQYLADALSTVPSVILSQIRRTTDAQRFAMDGLILYASFLTAALWTEGAAFLNASGELRSGIAAIGALIAFVIAEAYVLPVRRGPTRALLNAVFAISVSFLVQSVLVVIDAGLTVSLRVMILGGGMSAVLLSAARTVFPRSQRTFKAAGRAVIPLQDLGERSRAFRKTVWRGNINLSFCAVLLCALGVWSALGDRVSDRAVGGAIIATALYILYQVYRKGWTGIAAPNTIEPASSALYRSELEHRRDALLTIGSWYVFPYLGALLAFALRLPLVHPERLDLTPNIIPFVVLSIVWSFATKKLSARAAKKLQDEIDRL